MDKIKGLLKLINKHIINFGEKVTVLISKLIKKINNNDKLKLNIKIPQKIKDLEKPIKYKISGYGTTCVGLIFILLIVASIFGGRSYTKTIDIYLNSIIASDAESKMSVMPDEIVDLLEDAFISENKNINVSDAKKIMIADLKTSMLNSIDKINKKCGTSNWEFKYKILEERDYTEEQIDSVFSEYNRILKTPISSAKSVEISTQFTKLNEILYEDTILIRVCKIGNSWYVIS